MTALMVVIGAMIGAPARYLIDQAIQARFGALFPWGTLVVNVCGSFLLGALVGLSGPAMALLGIGLCGALTTYSTFGYETVRLVRDGAWAIGLLNVIGSTVAGLAAAYLGVVLAHIFV